MKCKFCGKKGVKLSHFPKAHGALLARRAARGRKRGKAASPSSGRTPKRSGRRKRATGTDGASAGVPETPSGYVVETITWRRA